jgi:voltage-gated potassium channel
MRVHSDAEHTHDDGRARHTMRRNLITAAGLLVLATCGYGFFPWNRVEPGRTAVVVTTFACGVVGSAALVVWQLRAYRKVATETGTARVRGLLMAVYIAMLFFASAYYLLAAAHPEQIVGLRTRTDALYFTLTILSTVGFGDVHAAGQAARAMVSLQIGFDLLVIGLAVAAAKAVGGPHA